MRKLIKKQSETVKQITCTTLPTLFLFLSFSPSQTVQGEVSHQIKKKATAEWLCLYLTALMTFFLLHCSSKMLPKQQEGPVHVMMALVKPLIVCIWVELELVIGECTHCLISEPLPRKLIYSWKRQSFLLFRCLSDYFLKIFRNITSDGRCGLASKYFIKSLGLSVRKPEANWEFCERGQTSCLLA